MPARRFPPPWSAEEQDACFVVRDANGHAIAYVYFEDEPGRGSVAKLLTRDEASQGDGKLSYGQEMPTSFSSKRAVSAI
jgi:hypothetical protein